jgi:hypothetical protein
MVCFLMAKAVQGRARRCERRSKKWAAKNAKDRCKCGQSTNSGALRSKGRCASYSRRAERQIVKESLEMRKISVKMILHYDNVPAHDVLRASFCLRTSLQKWTICLIHPT